MLMPCRSAVITFAMLPKTSLYAVFLPGVVFPTINACGGMLVTNADIALRIFFT
jgi:hypothetical protein